MDGIKLDPESEMGQVIPFHLFNKFFPKFRAENETDFLPEYNYLNSLDEIIEESINESEDELFNGNDYGKGLQFNNDNQLDFQRGKSEAFRFKSIKIDNNHNINKLNTFYSNSNSMNNYNEMRHSKTNPINIFNMKNNLKFDENIQAEIEKKRIEKYLNKLNKYLCEFYTIYQFCVNQYYDTLHKALKIINNYFINYESFCDMDMFKKNMNKIKDNLLSRIVFLNNDNLTNLYNAAREKPTLLKGVFDFNNFFEEYPDEEEEKLDNNRQSKASLEKAKFNENTKRSIETERPKYKIKDFSPKEMTLIKTLFYFCGNYDKIKYIKNKIKY
jgi:hypothetical protein